MNRLRQIIINSVVHRNIATACSPSRGLLSNVYDLHLLEESPTVSSQLSKSEALKLYKDMQRIRKMENLSVTLYYEKKIRGFCHIYLGQEACACGINAVMRPEDTVITSYRCHGWALLMGQTMENIIGELLGKINGSARGKGGSMHIYGNNFYGGNGIVGGHVPLGTGIALAHKYRNSDGISFTIYGDGACDQGQTLESYNMAKLWNLPIVYIIENNLYSMGTSIERHSANPKYYTRGDLIPGIRTDGMDVLAIRGAGKFAVNYIKSGKGPIILQLDTYRYSGHSMSDPGTSYRSKDEIRKVRENKDCIKNFTDKLLETQLITKQELIAIDKEVKNELDEATEKCFKAPSPGLEEIYQDIYKEYNSNIRMPSMYKQHTNVSPYIKKKHVIK